MIREKKTKSGPLLEVDFYPVFKDGRRIPERPPKTKRSTEAQEKYNQSQASKKLIRNVNANFGKDDYFLHPTYNPIFAPCSEKKAKADMRNYIARIKTRRKAELKRVKKEILQLEKAITLLKENEALKIRLRMLKTKKKKLSEPLRYIYVIEKQVYKRGKYAGMVNYHFHMFITGGLSAGTLESLWGKGVRTNAYRFQPDKFGPESAALYISKDPQGTKRFVSSKNLKKPDTPPPKDGLTSARQVEKYAKQRIDDAQYWERKFKGYRFVRCYARQNPYNSRWYVSVIMYKTKGDPPAWSIPEWLDD